MSRLSKIIFLLLGIFCFQVTSATEELVVWSERSYYVGDEGEFLMIQCNHYGGHADWPTTYSLLRKVDQDTEAFTEQYSSFTEFKRVQEGSYGEVYWATKNPTLDDSGEYLCVVTKTPDYPPKKGIGNEDGKIETASDNFTVTILSIDERLRELSQKTLNVKSDEKMYIAMCWTLLMVDCDYTGGDPTANLYATLLKEASPGEFVLKNTTFEEPHIMRRLDGTGKATWTTHNITAEDAGKYSCVLILDHGIGDSARVIKTASDTFEVKVKEYWNC